MKSFPKKYKPQDLRNRSKNYKYNEKSEQFDIDSIFHQNFIPTSRKLSYRDFFLIYLKDFFNCWYNIQSKLKSINQNKKKDYQNLFFLSNNQFENISWCYTFFNKKNQTLSQVWAKKLERRILSINKKNLNANNKILNTYFSSQYKFSIPDSDNYIYLVDKFHSFWESWKIKEEINIWYRSFNLQTSIPADHIIRKDEKKPHYILKYFVWAKCEALPVCVEDIDLCCWDVALLVHPKDKRYNKHIWKKAIIPLCNRQIPIIWDENVNIALNNWIQRICPCSDQKSIALAEKYWLPTDIYVFNDKWLYTNHIHEKAFIWQERNKYYNNIEWFIHDIWNLAEKSEIIKTVPYLKYTEEKLVPFKIKQIIIDTDTEKSEIINDILERKLHFSFLEKDFWNIFEEIENLNEKLKKEENSDNFYDEENETQNLKNQIFELKQKIISEIEKYLPKKIICNSQLPYWWRIPLREDDEWNLSFFDVENIYQQSNSTALQKCFDFVLLSLIRMWILWSSDSNTKIKNKKLCEYEKIFSILSQNEKKIQYFVQQLQKISWENPECLKFLKIIQNITDENNSTIDDCSKLINNSDFLKQEWNYLFLNLQNFTFNEYFDPDFIQLCLQCYTIHKWIKFNKQTIYSKLERKDIFHQLILQKLFLWESISHEFFEFTYDDEKEFMWEKHISKTQLEQHQRDLFSMYWENPTRLSFLVNQTYDQKEILLNNIFLKQIWNAVRLCIQKNFLPKDIKATLSTQHTRFDDFDLSVIWKLNELYNERKEIVTFDEHIQFFKDFKHSIQNLFFSRYLEIQKIWKTKDVQFVCSYFFSFLLTVLYPFVPEYVKALCYVSWKDFITSIPSIHLDRVADYNTNILYDTFIKIKKIKTEFNIKQHEYCKISIKCSPTLWEIFQQYEELFKNYFHISDIIYIRLHEQNPLWYDIISDDIISIWIQAHNNHKMDEKSSMENIEKDLKHLEDKLVLIRERMHYLPEWEEYSKAEKEYTEIKEELENLTIKYSLLSSK